MARLPAQCPQKKLHCRSSRDTKTKWGSNKYVLDYDVVVLVMMDGGPTGGGTVGLNS